MRTSRTTSSLVAVAATLVLCGCSSGSGGRHPGSSTTGPRPTLTRPSAASSPAPGSTIYSGATRTTPVGPIGAPSRAEQVFAAMTARQRVGQLLMVDCPTSGITDATRTAITRDHVGAVILDGTTQAGLAAMRSVTGQLRGMSASRAGLFIATDQEGGVVQRLGGPGFDVIPNAVVQGERRPAELQRDAQGWGRQLRDAGVNLDLAPVLDTVPPGNVANPPIGDLRREYGRTPDAVETHGLAVLRGLLAAGVDPTVKHFPGLGRVAGTTDDTSGVIDDVTTRNDPYLAPFRAAVAAKVPFVMMSTAVYSRIDAQRPAAFSRTIVTDMLRGDLGFRGVVISDDIGAAAQVSGYSLRQRAVDFVAAGGDMILTVDASAAGPMTDALIERARSSAAFGRAVNAAEMRVLAAKQARGLL